MTTRAQEFDQGLKEALPSLHRFALSLTNSSHRAEDLVQETILKACKNYHTFELGTKLKAWLFTILRNEFYSLVRKSGREVADIDGAYSLGLAASDNPEDSLVLKETLLMSEYLSSEQRSALFEIAIGQSYENTARKFNIAVGTVKSRVNRARTELTRRVNLTSKKRLLLSNQDPDRPIQRRKPTSVLKTVMRIRPPPLPPTQPCNLSFEGTSFRLHHIHTFPGGAVAHVFEAFPD